MARNGSGTYSLPSNSWNPAVVDTDISAPDWNDVVSDLETAMSDSIASDGQTTITANLPMAGFKHTGVGNGTAATDYAAYGQLLSGLAYSTGFLGGLTLSTAGGSGTFGIAAGAAVDSTSASLMRLTSAWTKTTASWVAGTGNGGIDTGSVATSTWYHVFLISTASGVVDVLFSLSATAPTMPSSYTLKRRIGAMKTDGSSHWTAFSQDGNEFLWLVAVNNYSATPGGTASTAYTITVPTGVKVIGLIRGYLSSGTTAASVIIQSPDETGAISGAITGNVTAVAFGATNQTGFQVNARTDTGAHINASVSTTDASLVLTTYGWIDRRGQG